MAEYPQKTSLKVQMRGIHFGSQITHLEESTKTNHPLNRTLVMETVNLRDEDLKESFARSSGPGGQHVNKVSTAVTLTHLPTGISVTVSDTRSQSMNRGIARERLSQKITALREARRLKAREEASKARRRRAKRSPSEKRKLVEGKRRRSEVKKGRGRVSE
jgi:protein subunit release factor B